MEDPSPPSQKQRLLFLTQEQVIVVAHNFKGYDSYFLGDWHDPLSGARRILDQISKMLNSVCSQQVQKITLSTRVRP